MTEGISIQCYDKRYQLRKIKLKGGPDDIFYFHIWVTRTYEQNTYINGLVERENGELVEFGAEILVFINEQN